MSKMQERLGDLVEIETASSMGRTAEEEALDDNTGRDILGCF